MEAINANGAPTSERAYDAVACYERVSSEAQKQQGTVENQRAILERWAATQGITPVGWYRDEAVSGTITFAHRPAGQRLMADVQAGRVRTVVVRKLDRLGRNARDVLIAIHAIEQAGAKVISLKEAIDTSTSAGRFYCTVLAGVAELERDTILERVMEGRERRTTHTAWMGGHAPYGYRVQGKRKDARLVLNDTVDADDESGFSEAEVVRLIFRLVVERDLTTAAIAEHLNALGIPTREKRSGKRYHLWRGHATIVSGAWGHATVAAVLRNKTYMGVRTYRAGDGTRVTHPCPALVDVETWERAQHAIKTHKPYDKGAPVTRHVALLRDLVTCGECGQPYANSVSRLLGPDGTPGGGPLRWYYACASRHYHTRYVTLGLAPADAPLCRGQAVKATWLEGVVWADIEEFAYHPQEALRELAASMGLAEQTSEGLRERVAKVQRELDGFQGERDRILALYAKEVMSEEDVTRQLARIKGEMATKEQERARAERDLEDTRGAYDQLAAARALLVDLHTKTEEPMTEVERRTVVRTLVHGIVVETRERGLSLRGRMRYRAVAHITYLFNRPETVHTTPRATSATTDVDEAEVQVHTQDSLTYRRI
jgi:site-specific DNA recombinase